MSLLPFSEKDLERIKAFAEDNWGLPEREQLTVEDTEFDVSNPWIDRSGRFPIDDAHAIEEWGRPLVVEFCQKALERLNSIEKNGENPATDQTTADAEDWNKPFDLKDANRDMPIEEVIAQLKAERMAWWFDRLPYDDVKAIMSAHETCIRILREIQDGKIKTVANRGTWLEDAEKDCFVCSQCGYESLSLDDKYVYGIQLDNYCPYCGSDNREEDNNINKEDNKEEN